MKQIEFKSTRVLLLVLALAAAALAVVSRVIAGGVLPNVLFAVAAALAIAASVVAVRYLAGEQGAKFPLAALSAFALSAIFLATCLFLRNQSGFSFALAHALLDGITAALLLLLCACFVPKISSWIAVAAGVIVFALSLLSLSLALELVLIGLAALLLAFALLKAKGRAGFAIAAALVALAVLVAGVLDLVGRDVHMYIHFGVFLFGLLALYMMPALAQSAAPQKAAVGVAAAAAAAAAPLAQPVTAPKPETGIAAPPLKPAPDKKSHSGGAPADVDSLVHDHWIDKKYGGLSLAELLDAPVDALYGVSAGDAELLQSAFGIKTIGDLASNKFFAWAEEIANAVADESRG